MGKNVSYCKKLVTCIGILIKNKLKIKKVRKIKMKGIELELMQLKVGILNIKSYSCVIVNILSYLINCN